MIKDYGFSRPLMAGRDYDRVPGVYALVDPRTGTTMYVGKSVNIGARYRSHLQPNNWQSNFPKMAWIDELRSLGLMPTLVLIERCDWPEMDDVEKETIREFRANGECELNIAVGGSSRSVSAAALATRDDWIQLGAKLKLLRELAHEVQGDCGGVLGAKYSDKASKIVREIDKVRNDLDNRVHLAFPGWEDAKRVFYGVEGPSFYHPSPANTGDVTP